ncbi:hypothetical protein PVAP13_9KG400095 [Panicum virgatum]|uniref:Uncharacterized protein n=1 Tax=Panicum virgatum TaxID=38727 RepID=A0A8T0N5C2_PANVG|nr:hypothetical protein PVAP13_9KG400095 [Panicum virgatum]
MDLGMSMTTRGGSEQADNIVRAINNEPEEGLGQIEFFDWDEAMLKKEIDSFRKRYYALPDNDDYDAWAPISDQQLKDMELRFAICRIKAHKMLKGEDLSIAELRNMYPPAMLEEEGYFRRVERHFEWYFDRKYCEFAHLEDYQRLALRNPYHYLDWEFYHKNCNTLQGDREYVYFWEKLSSKTKRLKNFRSAKVSEQERVELEVFYHAVKIAGECTHCFTPLLHNGYNEYLWSVRYDKTRYEDSASLYFDIWKLVAKQKYYTYVAEINGNVPEDEAYEKVMEAVKKFIGKSKSYYDYAKKKLDIAEKIGLVLPAQRGRTVQRSLHKSSWLGGNTKKRAGH